MQSASFLLIPKVQHLRRASQSTVLLSFFCRCEFCKREKNVLNPEYRPAWGDSCDPEGSDASEIASHLSNEDLTQESSLVH